MTLIFAKLARDEMAEAKRYYERQQRGLGRDFQRDAEVSAKRILEKRPFSVFSVPSVVIELRFLG